MTIPVVTSNDRQTSGVELFNIINQCPAQPLTARPLPGPPIFILPGRLPAARASLTPLEGSSTSLRGEAIAAKGVGRGRDKSLCRSVYVLTCVNTCEVKGLQTLARGQSRMVEEAGQGEAHLFSLVPQPHLFPKDRHTG